MASVPTMRTIDALRDRLTLAKQKLREAQRREALALRRAEAAQKRARDAEAAALKVEASLEAARARRMGRARLDAERDMRGVL